MQCFRSQAGLCWRVHGYSIQLNWQHLLQGTRQKWTDLSHHAQLSMCTSRDKMAASGMDFSVLIECEFVAVVSWKVGWLCCFYTKFALLRSDDWWVSFTRPWAVFTRLGNRNVYMCAHYCYKMVHFGTWDWCIMQFVQQYNSDPITLMQLIVRYLYGNLKAISWTNVDINQKHITLQL